MKRAILPAAISGWAAIRLLAEARSREQSRWRRRGRSATIWPVETDDRQEQNSAYSPDIVRCMVPLAQSAELRFVEPVVEGSSPSGHPQDSLRVGALMRSAFRVDKNLSARSCCTRLDYVVPFTTLPLRVARYRHAVPSRVRCRNLTSQAAPHTGRPAPGSSDSKIEFAHPIG